MELDTELILRDKLTEESVTLPRRIQVHKYTTSILISPIPPKDKPSTTFLFMWAGELLNKKIQAEDIATGYIYRKEFNLRELWNLV